MGGAFFAQPQSRTSGYAALLSHRLSCSYFGALLLPRAGVSVGCGGVALVYIFSAGCCSPVFFVVSIKNIFPAAKKNNK